MSIQAIIWDFGGVLVRTEDFAERDALALELGLTPHELAMRIFDGEHRHQAQLGSVDGEVYMQEVAAEFGMDVAELHARFFGDDRLDEELMAYLRGLRPRYQTALLSNALSTLRSAITDRFPILDAFDVVIISAEVGLVKPDAAIYELALKRLGAQPAEAVFIDDFAENVEGARQVGLRAIHFQSRQQALGELDALLARA